MAEQQQSAGFWAELVAFLKTLVVILGLAFLIRVQVVEPFKIPSGSMKPTLQIGDYILVLKFWYGLRIPFVEAPVIRWSTPKRGDVVVFTRPDDPATPTENDSAIHIIKRVVGLPERPLRFVVLRCSSMGNHFRSRTLVGCMAVARRGILGLGRCRLITFFFLGIIAMSPRTLDFGRFRSSMMIVLRGKLLSCSGRGIVSHV